MILPISLINYYHIFSSLLKDFTSFIYTPNITSLVTSIYTPLFFKNTVLNAFYFTLPTITN
jgi:hypothetical protein